MAETIRKEPEKFWFYNNGITVIAEDYDTIYDPNDSKKVEKLTLEEFSIINGAQTTSALGRFKKEADMNGSEEDIEKLKKVYVLARVLKVVDDDFKSQIAVYNNTQNPITTRDMASNRYEQLQLHNGLINGVAPNIFVEIRRGTKPPADHDPRGKVCRFRIPRSLLPQAHQLIPDSKSVLISSHFSCEIFPYFNFWTAW